MIEILSYVSTVLGLAGALVAIHGETWRKRGTRRTLTPMGWASLAVVLFASGVSIVSTILQQRTLHAQQAALGTVRTAAYREALSNAIELHRILEQISDLRDAETDPMVAAEQGASHSYTELIGMKRVSQLVKIDLTPPRHLTMSRWGLTTRRADEVLTERTTSAVAALERTVTKYSNILPSSFMVVASRVTNHPYIRRLGAVHENVETCMASFGGDANCGVGVIQPSLPGQYVDFVQRVKQLHCLSLAGLNEELPPLLLQDCSAHPDGLDIAPPN